VADSTSIVGATAGSVLTVAAVQAGLPLGIGFAGMGVLGAVVGHARWTLEQEKRDPRPASLTYRQHVCMIMRAVLMAEFVAMVLLLAWLEYSLPWTWGLIICAISSVFAADTIELMWQAVQARFKRLTGVAQ